MHFAAILAAIALFSGFTFVVFQLVSGPFASFVSRLFALVGAVVDDVLRAAGASVAFSLLMVNSLWSVLVGRWAAAGHYLRAAKTEFLTVVRLVYRAGVRRPLEFLWLGPMVRQVEDSVGNVIARAPGRDQRRGRDEFKGYRVLEALPSGGSGARLWLAEPIVDKKNEIGRTRRAMPERVVIKAFSLEDGTELPQMLRENRALEAARRMGQVIEHGIDGHRFYYVMPFVPGEDLRTRTLVLHERAERQGLDASSSRIALGYLRDLLDDLERFHAAGLWHKDVKPENILVDHGRARLVDLGLVTPLASGMTLTTHGTEYYRDPELVREALRGVKVHEVDGVRFDLYGAGAVLFSLFECSFPAHGSLSRFAKRCPDAVAWIVRRAMADIHQRYRTAREMRADVDAVLAAADPYAFKPAQLPSWRAADATTVPLEQGAFATASQRTEESSFASAAPSSAGDGATLADRPTMAQRSGKAKRSKRGVRWSLAAVLIVGLLFTGVFLAAPTNVTYGPPEATAYAARPSEPFQWSVRSSSLPSKVQLDIVSFTDTGSNPNPDGGELLVVDMRGGRAREEGDALLVALAAEGITLHGFGGPLEDPALALLQKTAQSEFREYLVQTTRLSGFGHILKRRAAQGLDGILVLRADRSGAEAERLHLFAAMRNGSSPIPDLLSYLCASSTPVR